MNKNKISVAIASIMVITIALTLFALPLANAHTPPWQITTYAYTTAQPNPVGVGQEALIYVWLDWTMPGVLIDNNVRFHNYKLTITKPDGKTETRTWPTVVDTTSSAYTKYTPDQVGTYTLLFEFLGDKHVWNAANTPGIGANAAYENDTFLPSSATATLTVQEERIAKLPDTPLPTGYWTRPITGENLLWDAVASNWLGGAAVEDRWQKDGSAPKTPHVMWTRTLEFGGLVGSMQDPGATFYTGFSYETRFNDPIIIGGILFYRSPLNHAGSGGDYIAVDLRTGEEKWRRADIAPTKGQLFDFENPNQHGAVAGTLWQTSTVGTGAASYTLWQAFDAFTGKSIFNLTSVPNGFEAYTKKGEIVRYVLTYNSAARSGRLLLWNYSAAPSIPASLSNPWRPLGKNINASTAYSWNVTIPDLSGSTAPTIIDVIEGDLVLGRSSDVALTSLPRVTANPWTMWALNLNASKGTVGSLLWIKNYTAPTGNITRMLAHQPLDPVYRTWAMTDFETGQRLGYSLDTGDLLWGPVGEFRAFNYYSSRAGFPAYGNLYVSGYGGEIQAFSMNNGTLLWKYNNTNSGIETPWGMYPIQTSAVADGVIYSFAGEHSPNTPLYKGYRAYAVDAFTGEELWTLLDWSASGLGTSLAPIAIADGFMVYANAYDGQIYSVGKGPSATTVSAPGAAITLGQSLVITGTVTDESPGSKIKGTAAVSDDSMSAWMEYKFLQKPRPTNATGVEVILSVLDSNGNFREIGKTTSDTTGFYNLQWTPDIAGKYMVVAQFAGTEGY
ncbi:MAG TPA: PQQ-binding-like beta-propeller repeat protein, partial [Candidatus Bathyarchaeia archaeon]|nr:PQQ-binding-like beta-propeller repeat protein [Candidatus Bathyarchaeia archaeon]